MSAGTLPRLFVTDFDGTLTRRDFFWLAVEAFAPAHLEHFWEGYRAGRLTHFEALAGIFAGLRASEEAMEQLLLRAEPDPHLATWIARLQQRGWEVVVASAGCAWYIERILRHSGVALTVHANPGEFRPGDGLHMRLPLESPFLSRTVGIDKAAIVRQGIEQGREVAFAGDGFPDAEAARLVPPQRRFARADLAQTLQEHQLPFQPFERWGEVAQILCEETD
ncbi:MAG: HAD-IB family phosphatase [Gemmataceae bacterium]